MKCKYCGETRLVEYRINPILYEIYFIREKEKICLSCYEELLHSMTEYKGENMDNLKEFTDEQLDHLMSEIRTEKKNRKAEVKQAEKNRKAELMEENKAKLEKLNSGTEIEILLKGKEEKAILEKVTDKRFIVIHNEVKKTIMFDKLVEVIG